MDFGYSYIGQRTLGEINSRGHIEKAYNATVDYDGTIYYYLIDLDEKKEFEEWVLEVYPSDSDRENYDNIADCLQISYEV